MTKDDKDDNGSDFSRISDIELLARWLDTRFSIPGTGIRFGLDSLIGLIPGVGDASTAVIGLYLITRAWREGASFWVILRMLWNMLLDFLFGSIPLIGDIFDVVFRSNTKNARLLHRHLEKRAARQNSESAFRSSDYLAFCPGFWGVSLRLPAWESHSPLAGLANLSDQRKTRWNS